jgi:hypothetical protein
LPQATFTNRGSFGQNQQRRISLVERVVLDQVNDTVVELLQGETIYIRLNAVRCLGNRRRYGGRVGGEVAYKEPARVALTALDIATYLDNNDLVQEAAKKALENLDLDFGL